MTSIPTSIRVGYRDYAVEDWPIALAAAESKLGLCDKDNGVIRIAMAYPVPLVAETLLHEVMHAAWRMGCLGAEAPDEEKTVSILSIQMCQIWRDNPDLVAYLSEALRP